MVVARKAAGLTQAKIAEKLGIGQSYVSKIERGDCYVDVLLFLDWCNACGFAPSALIAELDAAIPSPIPC